MFSNFIISTYFLIELHKKNCAYTDVLALVWSVPEIELDFIFILLLLLLSPCCACLKENLFKANTAVSIRMHRYVGKKENGWNIVKLICLC